MICVAYITMEMNNPTITNGPNGRRLDKIISQELHIKVGYNI